MPRLEMAVGTRLAEQGAQKFEQVGEKLVRTNERIAGSTKQVDDRLKDAGGRFTSTGKSAASMSTNFALAQAKFLALVATIRRIEDSTRAIAEFERTMATVRGVAQATSREFEQLERAARSMGASTRFTAAQAGEGLLFLSRAGFEASESLAALPHTLDLAIAGALDLGFAADAASNILSQFNLKATETGRVVDVLVNTANSANTDVRQLAEAMKFAGPPLAAIGTQVELAAAAIGVLGDSGIQASLAGTNLRGTVSGLLAPTSAAMRAIRGLGLTMADLDPRTNSLIEIFRAFRDAGLGASEATQIFGRRNQAAALILAQNVDKMEELAKSNELAEGTARDLARTIDDTLEGSFKSLGSAAEALLLAIGDAGLKDGLREVVDTVTGAMRILAGMRDTVTDNIVPAEALAFAIKAIGVAATTYASVKIVQFLFAQAAAARAATISVTALNAAISSNPWGAAAIAVSTLAVGIWAYKDAVDAADASSKEIEATVETLTDSIERYADSQIRLNRATEGGRTSDQIALIKQQINEVDSLIARVDKLRILGGSGIPFAVGKGILDQAGTVVPPARIERSREGIKPFLEFADVVDLLKAKRHDLGIQIEFLNSKRKSEAEVVRTVERAERDREKLLEGLAVRHRDLEAAIRSKTTADSEDEAVRNRFLDRAKRIIDDLKLEGESAEDLKTKVLGLVNANLELEKRLEARTQIEKALADQRKRQNAEASAAIRTIDETVRKLQQENEVLKRRIELGDQAEDVVALEIAAKKALSVASGERADAIRKEVAEARRLISENARLRSEQDSVRSTRVDSPKFETSTASNARSFESETRRITEKFATIEGVAETAADASRQAFGAAFNEIARQGDDVAGRLKAAFGSFIQQTATQTLSNIASAAIGAGIRGLGAAFAGGSASVSAGGPQARAAADAASVNQSLSPFAMGGAFNRGNQIRNFANGSGFVTQGEVFFPLNDGSTGRAGERGSEAILPLQRDSLGRLGVASSGEGSRTVIHSSINVYTPDADSFRSSKKQIAREMRRQGRP